MHPIHPMIVHFPIALFTTAWLFDLLALWWRQDKLRDAALYMSIVGLLSAGLAVVTGHFAEEAVEHSGIPEQALEIHEQLGFITFWMFFGLLGLRLAMRLGWVSDKQVLAVAAGLAGVIVLLVASYFGGDLVYRYGAGVLPK